MIHVRILVFLVLLIMVVSCKTSKSIIPVTDEFVNMEFGALGDMDEGEEEDGEDESYIIIAPVTDEDVREEFGEGEGMAAATPVPQRGGAIKGPVADTALPVMDAEPLNAAIELETGQVLLSDSDSSIMLDEVEVVGIRRVEQFALESLSGYQLVYLKNSEARSSPLVREVKVREYSPITVEDRMYFGKRLRVKPVRISNARLYSFVKEHLGKPYQENYLDHLTLMQNLYLSVYEMSFPRTTSKAILGNYTEGKIHYTRDMKEGDLLFFRLRGNRGRPYTHIGIYLQNKRFLTVTPSGGVEITNLRNREWRTAYIGRGRVKNTED